MSPSKTPDDQREPSHASGPSRGLDIGVEAGDRLRSSGYLALRDVSCSERAGIVQLRGRLQKQYLKQIAQSIVAQIEGVLQVDNRIEVVPAGGRSPPHKAVEADGDGTAVNDRKVESGEQPNRSQNSEGSQGRC